MPSQQPDQLAAQLQPVISDVVGPKGYDLEEIEVRPAGRRRLVRVVVDSDDGVDLDEIARLSRMVAAALDEHDEVLGGPYTLEVTSPGVDRPLQQQRHWRRARHRLVGVRLNDSSTLQGRVGDALEDRVQLLVDGELRWLGYDDVAHAAVQVEFRPPPAQDLQILNGKPPDPAASSTPKGSR
jgi:ribosome maturation factor RimP